MHGIDWKKPLLLALVLTFLGGGAYWLEYSYKPKQEEKEREEKTVFSLKEKKIRSLSLSDGQDKSYSFQCLSLADDLCKPNDASRWEVSSPLKARADEGNVNALINSMSQLQFTEELSFKDESEEKRQSLFEEYGLAKEQRAQRPQIEVTLEDGQKITAYLGETHPFQPNLYLWLDSEADSVFLIPSYFKSNLEKPLTHWRNRKLVSLNRTQIGRFAIRSGDTPIEAQKSNGRWMINGTLPGDQEIIDQWLSTVSYLTAKEFVANNKNSNEAAKVIGSSRPDLQIKLTTHGEPEKSQSLELNLYRKNKRLLATVSELDPVYELDASSWEKLNLSQKRLQAQKLMASADRFKLKTIEISSDSLGKEPLKLTQNERGWSYEPARDNQVDSQAIQRLFDQLSSVKIQKTYVGKKAPEAPPGAMTVSLGSETDQKLYQFEFWKNASHVFVRDLKYESVVYEVDSNLWETLPSKGDSWDRDPNQPEPQAEEEHDHSEIGHAH